MLSSRVGHILCTDRLTDRDESLSAGNSIISNQDQRMGPALAILSALFVGRLGSCRWESEFIDSSAIYLRKWSGGAT